MAHSVDKRTRATVIRTENVFSTIAEIAETLSLTNEPDKLLHTSLDTLAEVLGIESGWVQMIETGGGLTLAASRGLTPDMTKILTGLKKSHTLVREVTGLGHKVVITNLATSDMDGIEPFHRAGIRWLIAVPLMTYRVHGILGAASRYRKRLDKHTPDLIMVTGRLIATALVKTNLARTRPASSAEPQGNGKKYSAESLEETRNRIREVQSRLAAAKAASSQDYAGHGDNQALAAVPHDDPAVDEKLDIVKSPVFPVSRIETPLDVEKLLRDIATGEAETLPFPLSHPPEPDIVAQPSVTLPAAEHTEPETLPEAGPPQPKGMRDAVPENTPEPADGLTEDREMEGATEPADETPPEPEFTESRPMLNTETAEDIVPEVPPETVLAAREEPAEDQPLPECEESSTPAMEEVIHVHGNGKKPEGAPDPAPGKESWFVRHSREMASFRARHTPLH